MDNFKNRFRQVGNRYGSVSVSARTRDNRVERMAYVDDLITGESNEAPKSVKYLVTVSCESSEDRHYAFESRNALKAAMKFGKGGTEGREKVYITRADKKNVLSAVEWSEEERKYKYVNM